MKLEVLISTMHREDHSLLEQMNIKTDAVVVNQCDRNEIEEFEYNSNHIKWLSLNERGVGLSRNTAIMRSSADILLFADDDVVYEDDYEKKIIGAFEKYPDADIIMFNLISTNPNRPETMVKKDHRVRWYNCLKYGACKIAIRRESVLKYNLFYSLLFGGGAKYQAGEDNHYLVKALQKGMKEMSSASVIGIVNQEVSTWFKGYNEKYYRDRGALFYAMYGKKALFYLMLMELKNIKSNKELPFFEKIRLGREGIKKFKITTFG